MESITRPSDVHLEDRPASVPCPLGCGEMAFGAIAGIKVVACPQCRGTLMQRDALAQLVAFLRAEYAAADIVPRPIDPEELQQHRPCPACQSPMEVHPYYGPGAVVIDSCNVCHLVWLDGAELARIESAPGRRR